jgi:hypothetical protein
VPLFYHETLELYQLLMTNSNTTQRPYKPDLRSTPLLQEDMLLSNILTLITLQMKKLLIILLALCNSVFCPSIYHVLHYAKNWCQISNHGNPLAILSNEKKLANETFSHYDLLKLVIMLFRWISISWCSCFWQIFSLLL